MTDDQPWDRNKGKFDAPSSRVPKAAEPLPQPDPFLRIFATAGDIESIEAEALSGDVETIAGEDAGSLTTESHVSLRNFVERIERIDAELADIRADRSEVMKEAKSNGFDLPALREVLRRRKLDPRTRTELDCLVETYESALGGMIRGMIDGGDLTARPALAAPKQALVMAEADAWASGIGR